jgi:hypothetical protein
VAKGKAPRDPWELPSLKVADWGATLAGRTVVVLSQFDDQGEWARAGTLAGYRTEGDGRITELLVAFTPDDRQWLLADEVNLPVKPHPAAKD